MQQCNRCLMDNSAQDFLVTEFGCNYCEKFNQKLMNQVNFKTNVFPNWVSKNSKYDAIVGVSGGVDSSYVLVKAAEMGIRCLAVHLDNGWNSEIAIRNIQNIVSKLGVPLITHVIDWEEYKAVQKSFINENVLDVELIMDNAMLKLNYSLAKKHNVKIILTGDNTSTEGMTMPENWFHYKFDARNIKSIAKTHGIRLKTMPTIGTFEWLWSEYILRIKRSRFLDYIDYNKEAALNYLTKNYNYTPYPYKHYESVFTRFYQGVILPRKFKIDKRKIHLSTLIITKQISRSEGLKAIECSPYPQKSLLSSDTLYVCKKLGMSQSEMLSYLTTNKRSHEDFPNELSFRKGIVFLYSCFKAIFKR